MVGCRASSLALHVPQVGEVAWDKIHADCDGQHGGAVSPPGSGSAERPPSPLDRMMTRRRIEAVVAWHGLADALARAGIVLPSLGVDQVPVIGSGVFLVELGRARPDVIAQLAAVVRLGVEARRAQSGAVAL